MNATTIRQYADSDEYQARRFANVMVNMLHDYIPRSCQRDAAALLYQTALDQGLELTNKAMRLEYEAWHKAVLPISFGENPGTKIAQKD